MGVDKIRKQELRLESCGGIFVSGLLKPVSLSYYKYRSLCKEPLQGRSEYCSRAWTVVPPVKELFQATVIMATVTRDFKASAGSD